MLGPYLSPNHRGLYGRTIPIALALGLFVPRLRLVAALSVGLLAVALGLTFGELPPPACSLRHHATLEKRAILSSSSSGGPLSCSLPHWHRDGLIHFSITGHELHPAAPLAVISRWFATTRFWGLGWTISCTTTGAAT